MSTVILLVVLSSLVVNASSGPRIAVIGGGIGGASFTRFLRQEVPEAQITLFERADTVGGRVLSSDDADNIELGASMAIQQNKYMWEIAGSLGLERRMAEERHGRGSGKLAIVSGGPTVGGVPRAVAFLESDYKAATILSMLWRYGPLHFFRLRSQGQALITAFEALYKAQDEKKIFRGPESLWQEASMERFTQMNCSQAMDELLGSHSLLIVKELVAGLMYNNYGQDWRSANALVCLTAVAPLAAGGSKAAWSVVGGNRRMIQGLLEECGERCAVRPGREVLEVATQVDTP